MKTKKLHTEDCVEDCERARSQFPYVPWNRGEGGQKFGAEDKNENRHKEMKWRMPVLTNVWTCAFFAPVQKEYA